jgi:hypothetical protein
MNSKALPQNLVRLAVVTAAVVLGLLSSSSCVEAQEGDGIFDRLEPGRLPDADTSITDTSIDIDIRLEMQWRAPDLSVEDSLQQTIFMENNFDNSDNLLEIELLAERWAKQLEAQDPEGRGDGIFVGAQCSSTRLVDDWACRLPAADTSIEDIQLDFSIEDIEQMWWDELAPREERETLIMLD